MVDDGGGDTFFLFVTVLFSPARKSDSGKIWFFGMEDRMARFCSTILTIPTITRPVKMRNSVIMLRILAAQKVYGNISFHNGERGSTLLWGRGKWSENSFSVGEEMIVYFFLGFLLC